MSTDAQLHRKLESFLKHLLPWDVRLLTHDFVWASDLVALRMSFGVMQWARLADAGSYQMFGIRKLAGQVPMLASELRASAPSTTVEQRPESEHEKEPMEHFMIVEITGAATARVYLSLHLPPDEWYVLDEHSLCRDVDARGAASRQNGSHSSK